MKTPVVTQERLQMLRRLYGPKLETVIDILKGNSKMNYPIILCGDQIEFEREHANTPPHERPDWPLPSFDARDWAAAFCKIAKQHGQDIDEEWMVTWFANALMRGYDQRASEVAAA